MDFILKRTDASANGIFGELLDHNGVHFCFTLEHPYAEGQSFIPKLAPGTYECVKGTHELEDGIPFEAFEIKGAPEFQGSPVTGILVHVGNYARDSHGCVLVGDGVGLTQDKQKMITYSKQAFKRFMELQREVESFILTAY